MTGNATSARVAIIGGGSAANELARTLADSCSITVYEPGLVGGECPYLACMPSKAMLHVARDGGTWSEAVAHRDDVTHGHDDSAHADELDELGVRLRRERARLAGAGEVVSDHGDRSQFDHVVIATGAEAIVPELDGAAAVSHLIWTSADVYRSTRRPERPIVLGGGVIGFELAELFARLGAEVTLVERSDRCFDADPPAVSDAMTAALERLGVRIITSASPVSVEASGDDVGLTLDDGSTLAGDRLVVAVGRRPRTAGLGLDALGIDGSGGLPIDECGRLDTAGSIWVIGDAAGRGEYTHLANHHAAVVADHLVGNGVRRFGDVALGSCVFTSPPMVRVGPTWSSLRDDDDLVTAHVDPTELPRSGTDRHGHGHLWVAARRSTETIVAASGSGASFDELVHPLLMAVDHRLRVDDLRRSMRPFPTMGEVLGAAWDALADRLRS